MKLEPYKKMIKFIAIDQLTQNGWVDLIRIPIDNYEKLTPKEIQECIEEIQQMIFKNNKMYLSVQGKAICIKGMDEGGTFRVHASPNNRGYNERRTL